MIKIPGKNQISGDLASIYDQEFFQQHANNMPAFRELAMLIDEVIGYEHERSIMDIGCGHGFLVESLRQRGYASSYGLEGSSSAQSVWPEQFHSYYTLQDITDKESCNAARATDVVCSFETAEHIDSLYAKQYIGLLTQHRPGIIFFSAATVLQDCGQNPTHVNEQPFSYWISYFREDGYELDILDTVRVRNSMFGNISIFQNAWWYPKNILIFREAGKDWVADDEKIANLANSEIKWFGNNAGPNRLIATCIVRDRQEYNYLVMDAVARSVGRLSGAW